MNSWRDDPCRPQALRQLPAGTGDVLAKYVDQAVVHTVRAPNIRRVTAIPFQATAEVSFRVSGNDTCGSSVTASPVVRDKRPKHDKLILLS